MSGQLALWDDLEVHPTPSMLRGTQRIDQCAQCGTIVVSPDGHEPARCPCCDHEPTNGSGWWAQTLPVAGIHRRADAPLDCPRCWAYGPRASAS